MNEICRKFYVFAAAAIFGAALSVFLIKRAFAEGAESSDMLVAGTVIVIAASAAGFALRERRRWNAAQLIVDNQILHICAAKFAGAAVNADAAGEDIEVFISCFGILLNHQIIKFNQERIQLKTVELGGDDIVLTYGSEKKVRTIRLLHGKMEPQELIWIAEKFRYETGIVPAVNKKEEL